MDIAQDLAQSDGLLSLDMLGLAFLILFLNREVGRLQHLGSMVLLWVRLVNANRIDLTLALIALVLSAAVLLVEDLDFLESYRLLLLHVVSFLLLKDVRPVLAVLRQPTIL